MDFELSEDQKLLVNTVQSFVRKDSPVERMRRLRDTPLGFDPKVWKQMGELGWLGVMFPEGAGGAGMSFVEMGLIVEQLAMNLVPEPILPLIVAGSALARAGSEAQQEQFLAPSVAGEESLALASSERQSRNDASCVRTRATRNGQEFVLEGEKRWVQNGHAADRILVSARTAGSEGERKGVTLFVLDKSTPGLKVTPVKQMDGKHGAMLGLSGVKVAADRVVGEVDGAVPLLEACFDLGAAATCCEASGMMQAVLMMTRNYLTERKQFGRAIGSFQALQHRCVDMFVETELGKSTAILAMLKAEEADEVERKRAISAAKVQTIESGGFVTRQAIQLHGGIGVTDEHDVGLYFKRMQVLSALFGDDVFHARRFASLPTFLAHVS
ncbi:MAG: acyl-CoA dehydrogenase family protein [Polyangiaceae bacterium]